VSVKPLKIALVSDAVLPFHKGGKETRIYHLSKELVRMGQEVDVYTMKWWDGDNTYIHEGVTYHALCRLYPLYTASGRRSIKEGIMFGLACLKMFFYGFDIIETDHMPYFPLFFTKLVTVVKRKPLYATWHEVVGFDAWKKYMGTTKGAVAYAIERVSIMLPNHIIAVSEHTQKQLRTVLHYKGKLSLVSNGIDYVRIAPVLPAAGKSDIIYVGRLIHHKHVNILVEAVALLRAQYPDVRCIIVGGGPEHATLQALVKERNLEKNVTITGRLESSDDVYAFMKASKIFVSPSTREGFGITILEAFACGLSVVTVKHKDNLAQYLVTPETGIVCELGATDIAASIKTLLERSHGPSHHTTDTASYDWSQQAIALKEAYGL
jgi:glycosyltransferase involved in cell wall biosynthesis